MLEVLEHSKRLLHNLVRAATLDVDDEANATGIVLMPGIVETLCFHSGSSLSPSTM
jgi:hypothetical protein